MALFDTIRMGASGAVDYEIERSLRFNGETDDAYLKRTSVSSPTNVKIWTMSLWIKRDAIVNGNDMEILFGNDYYTASTSTRGFQFAVGRNDFKIETFDGASGMGTNVSSGSYRDPGAWMHIVVQCDTTQSTQSNRMRVYTNGTDIGLGNSISQNQELTWNKGSRVQYLGCHDVNGGATRFFRGYIAEAHFIDGQSLDPTNFAETDAVTGLYKPIEYTGTYGNNGWYLAFTDNSNTTATTLGKDYSGNGNNMTPFNFSVSAGEGNDSVEDTPTNNFPTINPLDGGTNALLTNGNLRFKPNSSNGGNFNVFYSTFSMRSGKWYFEVLIVATNSGTNSIQFGIGSYKYKRDGSNQNGYPGTSGLTFLNVNNSNSIYRIGVVDGSEVGSSVSTASTNDVYGIAFDADNKKVYFYKNGSAEGESSGYNVTDVGTGDFFFFSNLRYSTGGSFQGGDPTLAVNFGQRAFSYTAPTGYKKLNSKNLPDPTILQPNKHFDVTLYTGSSGTQEISTLNFQPDWLWFKRRDGTNWNALFDSVRGRAVGLASNKTNSEYTSSASEDLVSFDNDGFTVGANSNWGSVNGSGHSIVTWAWNGGGTTVTNTDGTISAQVRANTTAGFSIVTWTGNGSSGSTIGHGLGVTPNFCLMKRRDSSSNNWIAASFDLESARELNTTNAFSTGDYDAFFPSQPSSTTITMGSDSNNNTNGASYVGYIFSEVAGYSKFGTYTANGSSDGPFVNLGFTPAWIMTKRINTSGVWEIHDYKRPEYNPHSFRLLANSEDSEATSNHVDFVSNGFKVRNTFSGMNEGSGNTYFFMAFARSPFKNARAR